MTSTANVRVFEGAGRPTFRARSLVGLARALGWPDDAVDRIANGADPTALEPRSDAATPLAPIAAPGGRATVGGIDLATGAGDLPCRLMAMAGREGVPWVVDGADVSALAVEHARERALRLPVRSRPKFMLLDVLREPLPRDYDVVTCSLFLHHLSVPDAVSLLAKMRASAQRAVIVQDLLRSKAALRLTWLVTRLCSRNSLILEDGPASVAAAFTLDEARDIAARAGLQSAQIAGRWPYRWVCSAVH